MDTSSGARKRSISELLDQETGLENDERQGLELEPPKARQRLEKDVHSQLESRPRVLGTSENEKSLNRAVSGTRESPGRVEDKARESAFLAYPDLSHPKPISTPFQQPSQLISFSYTPGHVQEFTNSALRYFVDPPLGAHLSYGYERWIKRPDERGRLDALLKAISKVKRDAEGNGAKFPEIGVISWRGVMTKILTAPYEDRDGWELNVMSVNGTLYFEEHLTDECLKAKNNMEPRQRSQTYYGYAFESYCTSEAPSGTQQKAIAEVSDIPVGWGGDVNTNVQWCSVVRTKLGDTRMIIGGEVDCVRAKYTGQTESFVELKTSLTIRGRQDEARFEKKLLKFYFQSFLLGVPEIVVGFRTPSGVLTTVQSFKTVQIPRMVRGKHGGWDPLVCLEFGQRVVSFLNDIIHRKRWTENRQPVSVWRVKFVPGSGLSVGELDTAEVESIVNGEDRVGFLPRWYWDETQRESQSIERKATADATSNGWRV